MRIMAGLKIKLSKYLRQRVSKFGLTESGIRSAHKHFSYVQAARNRDFETLIL